MKNTATIWITTAIACILLTACRANKEAAETNLSESAATVNSTATGNAPLKSSVAVQPDTNFWQLVYPKTAKTEGNLWRKGNVYTLDTNDVRFYRVDTSNVTILVECIWSGDGPMPAFKFASYAVSGGAQYPRPSGMSFISFLKSLEPEPEQIEKGIPIDEALEMYNKYEAEKLAM